jgi:hypothetical protein
MPAPEILGYTGACDVGAPELWRGSSIGGCLVIDMSFVAFCALGPVVPSENVEVGNGSGGALPQANVHL